MSEDLRAWLADDAALSPEELTERLRRRAPSSAAAPNGSAVHGALRRRSGFGPLSGLLRNDDVNDICLNGPGEAMIDAGGG